MLYTIYVEYKPIKDNHTTDDASITFVFVRIWVPVFLYDIVNPLKLDALTAVAIPAIFSFTI